MSEKSELKPSEKFSDAQAVLSTFKSLPVIGKSAGGLDIWGKRMTHGTRRMLLIGGVHGNETEGVAFTRDFFAEFFHSNATPLPVDLFFIPVMNPDGALACSRHNANGVDLNRNMPTNDWKKNEKGEKYYSGEMPASENETKILIQVLEAFKPESIISLHSWKPMINVNGPAHSLANKIHEKLNYEITEDIGYPTPGSLGTYAGWERKIPTITLEIERGLPLDVVYRTCRDGVLNGILTQ